MLYDGYTNQGKGEKNMILFKVAYRACPKDETYPKMFESAEEAVRQCLGRGNPSTNREGALIMVDTQVPEGCALRENVIATSWQHVISLIGMAPQDIVDAATAVCSEWPYKAEQFDSWANKNRVLASGQS